MCCSGPKWKREDVPDHKFDFIDVAEFRDTGCFTRSRYILLYVLFLKSFLVYISDLYTAIIILASDKWNNVILANNSEMIPFKIGKWIFTGCIIMSFLLLLWEAKKARAIIRSRDISYAFTNVMANNHYSLKSYNHFSFFCQINNSKKTKDDLAFFVFFTFKGWKRLVLADAPRQVINAVTLYSFGKALNFTTDISAYIDGSWIKATVLITMCFTVVVWAGSAVLLLIAAILYVPLLCYIQGNLKEYCCHKIDKRIAEMMKKKTRKRLLQEAALARKEAAGDYSHLKDKKGNYKQKPTAQPTLPKIDLFENDSPYGNDRKGGSYSDVSLRKEPLYYQNTPTPRHAYPPATAGWNGRPDGPQPQLSYGYDERSEVGYAGSVHSMDRLVQTPSAENHNDFYLSKAPSYRSQTSLNDSKARPWESHMDIPPVPQYEGDQSHQPQYFNDYAQHQHSNGRRSPGPNDMNRNSGRRSPGPNLLDYQQFGSQGQIGYAEEEYQPVNRRQLFEQTGHDRQASYGTAYGGTEQRPESAYDLGDYYASDQPQDYNQQQAPYRR